MLATATITQMRQKESMLQSSEEAMTVNQSVYLFLPLVGLPNKINTVQSSQAYMEQNSARSSYAAIELKDG